MTTDDTLDNMSTLPGDESGKLLADRYRILRKLGEGGMGLVYLAEDLELGNEQVAIKFIPPMLAGNKRSVHNLKKEAQTARRLSHPNIVRLHDLHTDGHQKFLVMEYIEGQTLEDWLADQEGYRVTLEQLLPLAEQIAAGVDHAHTQNVLHRDIKPSNIMIAADGTAKLLDFGIAREIKDSFTRVTGQETSGTLPYMSPEQLRGMPSSRSMDIYSLAAVLYECLCGHAPFHTGDLRHQILEEPVQPLKDERAAVLTQALSKESTQRPRSAAELVARLRGSGTPESSATLKDQRPQGHEAKGGRWIAAIFFLVLVGVGGYWLWKQQVEKDVSQRAVFRSQGAGEAQGPGPQAQSRGDGESEISQQQVEGIEEVQRPIGSEAQRESIEQGKVVAEQSNISIQDPPTEPENAKVEYEIRVTPDDALVTLTHDELGLVTEQQATDGTLSLPLSAGTYHVLISSTGFRPVQRDIEVSEEQSSWSIQLSERRGDLAIESNPGVSVSAESDGSSVRVGRTDGQGHLTVTTLREGDYNLTLSLTDYQDETVPVSLVEGRQIEVTRQLQPLPGRLRLAGRTGLEVYEDGRRLGQADEWIVLSAGEHSLELRSPGFRSERMTVTILANREVTRSSPNLVPESGSIRVTAVSTIAGDDYLSSQRVQMQIDDDPWQEVTLPFTEENVSCEAHTVTLRIAGYGDAEQGGVTVQDAQTVSARLELTPRAGKVVIGSNADDAEVFDASGRKLGNAGASLSLTPFVSHVLTVKAPKHEAVDVTVRLTTPGQDGGRRQIVLERNAGPAPGEPWTLPDLGMAFVHVAPGGFQMGTTDGDFVERPMHTVRISKGYWMAKHEVTNGLYQAFLGETNYDGSKEADGDYLRHHHQRDWARFASTADNYPIVAVSWRNAVAFCRWLTDRERRAGRLPSGYQYRLPTEAQWEYAARGGSQSRGYTYSGSSNIDEVAWCSSNSGKKTHPIGLKKANELGIYDMSGNVDEWCNDWFGRYSAGSVTEPVGPDTGDRRVLRGGSWTITPENCRVVYRHGGTPVYTNFDRGFRVALSVSED